MTEVLLKKIHIINGFGGLDAGFSVRTLRFSPELTSDVIRGGRIGTGENLSPSLFVFLC